ncbi:16S rRNA (uracil(1498)-N(3))-methyltransferase [Synechococcus sp. CS-197]|uniref:16S rRNA (uracil(1498)-N(3))-methyltransferase n=1 Tax=Synechococcus sp. CS-197 TaxID=2847985 RepID=UPI0001525686|nr:16S rRNA (uracil(1498)-N(3))-methyltransferase [Synechococcus sp. CS-197]MCT0251852.1 16S rRNA (uracil(1498)-N(3))-methyltransferase [Synechococcus sp. CS-197]PTT93253.1 16S rRNA (uracil(1498)-N(3))-methyltransferase [Pseudomonas sp. HMWF031]CAK23423.1 Conserved hypothetical protein [Synechococcus sp. WH 7803]
MNLILLNSNDHWIDAQRVRLSDRRAEHIRKVLRSQQGDTLRLGMLGGQLGTGRIEAIDAQAVLITVQLVDPPPARHRFDLVLALPRPKMLRRILRAVAEFGVGSLHLVQTARVDKSYWQSPLLADAKVDEALRMGLERSRDTIIPQVHRHRLFRPFIEDRLPAICQGRPCWIAHQDADVGLSAVAGQPAVVMIGPEGGFVPFELTLAEQMGAQKVHLGGRILSVDTAVATVLAQTL